MSRLLEQPRTETALALFVLALAGVYVGGVASGVIEWPVLIPNSGPDDSSLGAAASGGLGGFALMLLGFRRGRRGIAQGIAVVALAIAATVALVAIR